MEASLREERLFGKALFNALQDQIDAMLEDAEAEYGHEFNRADVKWLEATHDGSPLQVCNLVWKDKVILQVQLSMLGHASIYTEWASLRH